MVFNSFHFLWFFPLVVSVYFLLPFRFRWVFLLTASCYFYACLIPKYLLILAALILIDYCAGLAIEKASPRYKKPLLLVSLVTNVALLFVFKYFDFFSINTAALTEFFGLKYQPLILNLVLPLGISFHTFQSMAYTIEVYRGRQKAEKNLGIYSLYVMFFPQLVAGPIERPQQLLGQFREEHHFDYDRAVAALQLMMWGLLKKVVIADPLAQVVNSVYGNVTPITGLPLIISSFAFSIQIYCDFSGYSDIARGSAMFMGFRLSENFRQPYLSQSITEFWHRWHISLSTWFRDYVYIPMGGSRGTSTRTCFNIIFVFILSGFWHGANWTFLAWGALHGTFLVVSRLKAQFWGSPADPSVSRQALHTVSTFFLVTIAWVFFRAQSVPDALHVLTQWAVPFGGEKWPFKVGARLGLSLVLLTMVMLYELAASKNIKVSWYRYEWLRWVSYVAGAMALLNFGAADEVPFIYFQF